MYRGRHEWENPSAKFSPTWFFDMSSMGPGDPSHLPLNKFVIYGKTASTGIDAVHHQAGNYPVSMNKTETVVDAYAIATHYKKAATQGNTVQ